MYFQTPINHSIYTGEVIISGRPVYTVRGQQFIAVKNDLKNFVNQFSQNRIWHEIEPSEKEKALDTIWELAQEHTKKNRASIKLLLKKP